MNNALEASDGSIDPMFVEPFVDVDEWRDAPVRHRYVHGGFAGTDLRFSAYFPPAELYGGRFFHPLLHIAGTDRGVIEGRYDGFGGSLEFAFASGAYVVESNMGTLTPMPAADPTTAYRASAAAARYARGLAIEMYGGGRPYGYVFGGSGGAFKTMACVENVADVWDGAAPFVQGTPMSIPSVFSVQAHAMRVLWPKLPQIVDAVDPGGFGDMYAGLDIEERETLAEVTRMGFPPRAWFDVNRINVNYTMLWTSFADAIRYLDPTYYADFWTVPGYLGANPPESLLRARIERVTTVTSLVSHEEAAALDLPVSLLRADQHQPEPPPIALRLAGLPDASTSGVAMRGAVLEIRTGAGAGRRMYIMDVLGDVVLTAAGGDRLGLAGVVAGDEVLIDNRDYLAFQTYHRHVVADGYAPWRQFTAAGQPMYPQRDVLIGPMMAFGGAGAIQTGRFNGKMIVVQSMLDEAAYPCQADWYRQQVVAAMGDTIDDRYRLWFTDHAMHEAPTPVAMPSDDNGPARLTRTVDYRGVLEQALRDLCAWVEGDVAPPVSTSYVVDDGQVVLPATAARRRGIQPVVNLSVVGGSVAGELIAGGVRAEAAVGEPVEFTAVIEVPPGAGAIVAAEWDFEGRGDFPVAQDGIDGMSTAVTITATYAFTEPCTYFPAVRVISQRDGDSATPHARVKNLGRVRVVVS